jgi:hypothetical protein
MQVVTCAGSSLRWPHLGSGAQRGRRRPGNDKGTTVSGSIKAATGARPHSFAMLGWAVAALSACLLCACPARAVERVDTALVLALDVSASINDERYDLQRRGLAAAFSNEAVIEAVQSGENEAIAVTLVEWSGVSNQKQVIGWTLIKDAASGKAFGAALSEAPRVFADFTSIYAALDFSTTLLRTSGYDADLFVIDVSGDGSNNSGRPIIEARDAAIATGIAVNGLSVLASEPNLEGYYRKNIIGGEGSLVVVGEDFPPFANAILDKLVREIAGDPLPSFTFASAGAPGAR